MPYNPTRQGLEALLVREGYYLATKTRDGRRRFWEVSDAAPVSFLTSVKQVTGSRLTGRDTTGASTSTLDTSQTAILKKLQPDETHVLQLLIGFSAEPHPAAQRLFFEAPLGTTVFDLDQGRADSKNIGFIDGRVSSVEVPSGVFQVWINHNLAWGLKAVNAYPLQVDPNLWFLGMLFTPRYIGTEATRGGDVTIDGKPGSAKVQRPGAFTNVSAGRVEQNIPELEDLAPIRGVN